MTAEIPSGNRYEFEEEGIRERLNLCADQLEKALCHTGRPMKYANLLWFRYKNTESMRFLTTILPALGDPEYLSYKLTKQSPEIIGGLLALEVARHAMGDDWDYQLAETLSPLSDEIRSLALTEYSMYRGILQTARDEGWKYGERYKPTFRHLEISGDMPAEVNSRMTDIQDAFGFVLQATAITLKCQNGRRTLNENIDPDFQQLAKDYTADPGLWNVAIREFFEDYS